MASGEAKTNLTASFEKARQLAQTHEQPILALKAYGAWLGAAARSSRARAFGLLDFSMHCNRFAMEQESPPDADASLRIVRARDYFQLVLDQFREVYDIQVDCSASTDDADRTAAAVVMMPSKLVPAALLAVLQITLHNWACLEMNGSSEGLERAQGLLNASRSMEVQMAGFSSLGWPWEAVQGITSAVQALIACDFAAAEAASRSAVEVVRLNEKRSPETDTTAPADRGASVAGGDTELLQALCCYTLGLATETSACEAALQCYGEALMHLLKSHKAGLYQSVIEQTRGQLAHYVDEERHHERERLAAEETAAAAHADRKGQSGVTRVKKPQGTTRRTVRKGSNSRASVSGPILSPVVAPPIPEPLRLYLSEHGLSTLVSMVGSFKAVFEALDHSLPGTAESEPPPPSLFDETRFKASGLEPVFAVPLCTSTPLQWALRLREAANQPSATLRRSLWTPRPTLAPLLAELAAQRPPGPKSTAASQTRKEIVEGNSKLRQQVLQLFAPPAVASKVKRNAHESVDTVVQLLGQRLAVLLKTEKAFEDNWLATERVLSALQSYAVSQDLVRLKKTLVSQQRLRQLRQERSARTIAHFFRDVVGQRTRRVEQTTADHQRVAEREQASIVLQKYVRRWLAFKEARRRADEQVEYEKNVIVVQSLARRRFAQAAYSVARQAYLKRKEEDRMRVRREYAALQIQRVYRGHCSRLRCYHLRGLSRDATLHHLSDSQNYYATVIQKRVRGMLARLHYGKAVRAKRCYGRNVYRRQLWEHSCAVIQRAYRAHLFRRLNAARSASAGAGVLQGGAAARCLEAGGDRAAASDESANKAAAAAQCIQSAYRSCVARRRVEALRYARTSSPQSERQSGWASGTSFSLKECVF